MAPRWRKSTSGFRRWVLTLFLLPSLLFIAWNLASAWSRNECRCGAGDDKETYMWYAPHSGFSNQIGELRNALRVASILGRTLVVPPVTDHHALSLGSCPKYRILPPQDLRRAAWSHFSELMVQSRYFSIADILNVSSVSPKYVKTIDLRIFAHKWCGADVRSGCAGPLCHELTTGAAAGSFDHCLEHGNGCNHCIVDVDHSCATTVWTYHRGLTRRSLLAKPKLTKFSGPRVELDIRETLGGHTEAGKAKLLSFGSLFSGEHNGVQTHVDIRAPSGDAGLDEVLRVTEFFPFVDEILEAGKEFVKRRMKNRPFFCAQLRLLDGQFKNHWSKTFKELRSNLEDIGKNTTTAVFVMTDLPRVDWKGTYLEEVESKFEVFELEEGDELVRDTALKILMAEHGISAGVKSDGFARSVEGWKNSEVLLYLQEAICSCASSGFQGTAGSTITDNIIQMRNAENCIL